MKKTLLAISIVLLTGVIIFCTVWLSKNCSAVDDAMNGASLYTKEDLDSAYAEGYNKALENEEYYLEIIEKYKSDSEELVQLKIEYKNLQDELTAVNNDLQQAQQKNLTYEKNLKALRDKVTALEENIEKYEKLLKDVADTSGSLVATFYVGDEIHALKKYNDGAIVDVAEPVAEEGYVFVGWETNGEIVEVPGYIINEHTEFKAVFHCLVTFIVEGVEYEVKDVAEGAKVTMLNTPIKEGYTFVGWSLDGENVVDLKTQTITGPVTYKAVFELTYNKLTINSYETLEDGSLKIRVVFNGDVVMKDGQTIYCQGNPATVVYEGGKTYLTVEKDYAGGIWGYYCAIAEPLAVVDYTLIDLQETEILTFYITVSDDNAIVQEMCIEQGKTGILWFTAPTIYNDVTFTRLDGNDNVGEITFSEPEMLLTESTLTLPVRIWVVKVTANSSHDLYATFDADFTKK